MVSKTVATSHMCVVDVYFAAIKIFILFSKLQKFPIESSISITKYSAYSLSILELTPSLNVKDYICSCNWRCGYLGKFSSHLSAHINQVVVMF